MSRTAPGPGTLKHIARENYRNGIRIYKEGILEGDPSKLIRGSLIIMKNKGDVPKYMQMSNKRLNDPNICCWGYKIKEEDDTSGN